MIDKSVLQGCKLHVLDGIVTFFHEQSSKYQSDHNENSIFNNEEELEKKIKELRSVEGTTLLHVVFAVKQDQALGREYVNYLKVVLCIPILW